MNIVFTFLISCTFILFCLACGAPESSNTQTQNPDPPQDARLELESRRALLRAELLDGAYAKYEIQVDEAAVIREAERWMIDSFGKPHWTQEDADLANAQIEARDRLMHLWAEAPAKADAVWQSEYADLIDTENYEEAKHDWQLVEREYGSRWLEKMAPPPQVKFTVESQQFSVERHVREQLKLRGLERELHLVGEIVDNENVEDWLLRQKPMQQMEEDRWQAMKDQSRN